MLRTLAKALDVPTKVLLEHAGMDPMERTVEPAPDYCRHTARSGAERAGSQAAAGNVRAVAPGPLTLLSTCVLSHASLGWLRALWSPTGYGHGGRRRREMAKLDGKIALVSGAGRGIGQAIATKLASEGAHLVINDLDPEPADQTVLRRAGGKALPVVGSVTDPAFGEQFVQAALDEYGRIDIIVNNAGYTWDSVVQKMTDEQWYAMIDVHLTAPFRMLRAAAPYLRESAKAEAANGAPSSPARSSTSPRSPVWAAMPDSPATHRARPASSVSPRPWPRSGAVTTSR